MPFTIGLDTSNYTTSVAVFDGGQGYNLGRLLDVPGGTLGLRQSDALFQHVKYLPLLVAQLRSEQRMPAAIEAVGASTKPRWIKDSYMPCFLAGESMGRSWSDLLNVPFYPCAHQQGHVAAAAWSAGRADLMDRPHLAWHLSGGTTELLYVEPDGVNLHCERVGGTTDISAGQLIDRTGKRLGLAFPAGKTLDALASKADKELSFIVKRHELEFSLSGVENQANALVEKGETPANVALFTLDTVAGIVGRTTSAALERWPGLPVLCSGGVASNRRLREKLREAIFAPPQYSTDNALGVAILAHRALTKGAEL